MTRDGARLDDMLGHDASLIERARLAELGPFADGVLNWLDAAGTDAVLVRPDRVVFGSGEPDALRTSWQVMTRT